MDKAAAYPHVLDEPAPGAWQCTEVYANNRMEAHHGQLKRRLRPVRGLKGDHQARILIAGRSFIQNIRSAAVWMDSRSSSAVVAPS